MSVSPALVVGGSGYDATYSWEGSVVPEVTLVWEAVSDEPKFALLDVLLDGVEKELPVKDGIMGVGRVLEGEVTNGTGTETMIAVEV